ncbi:MAG: hypothetical protein IK085_10095 [Clostridia bacterium]|nr:hypothetical protein [Clostridia bacterium]
MTSKNAKRIISLVLVFVLAFSVSVFAYADNDETADNVVYENEEDIPVLHSDPDDFVLDDNWKPYDPDLFENDMPARDETWVRKGGLESYSNGANCYAEGFAVGTGYCYSIDQDQESSHYLYRKNMNNNSDAELMTPVGTIDNLKHANSMALATYTDNNSVVHRYLFVLANSSDGSNSYIIKLEYDGLNYWQVARYNLFSYFSNISKIKYYTNAFNTPMIQFLLGNNTEYYTIAVQRVQTGTHYLVATHRFDITIPQQYINYANQNAYYDSGKLYVLRYGFNSNPNIPNPLKPKENVVIVYNGIDNAISSLIINTLSSTKSVEIKTNDSSTALFEIEGIGFPVNNPNLDCDRLWFNTNEKISNTVRKDGGIYADTQNIK